MVTINNLTVGKFYSALANILVYDDHEQAFSTTFEFPCFWIGPLPAVRNAAFEGFLLDTNHDPLELWYGKADPNVPHKKPGWMEITGELAYQFTHIIENASRDAVLVERVGGMFAADLPWQVEDPANDEAAMLWSTGPGGN